MEKKRVYHAWTEEEREIVKKHYPVGGTRACMALMPNRSASSVKLVAFRLGIKAPKHLTGRKPGCQPWNKGLRYQLTGLKRQFQSGYRPWNYIPIGHEKANYQNYIRRKIADGEGRNYRPLHQLIWEEHHGPIPEGRIVCFKNRDRGDLRIENLELLTRAEMMARNSINQYPTELNRAMRQLAKLKKTIKQKDKPNEE